jgi:hypothetical protein
MQHDTEQYLREHGWIHLSDLGAPPDYCRQMRAQWCYPKIDATKWWEKHYAQVITGIIALRAEHGPPTIMQLEELFLMGDYAPEHIGEEE